MALCAPPVVRFGSLMRVKNTIYVRPPAKIGLYDRRFIASIMPQITARRRAGLSIHETAGVLGQEAGLHPFRLVKPWSAQLVLSTIREAELLRSADFARKLYE